MEQEKRDFFISYTKADKDWAVWIANVLKKNGYSVYVQALDIGPADNFIEKMNDFLENSGNFIAVWSKAYSESRFCMTEFQAAFNLWNKKQMDCFLSVRIDNYPIKPLYAVLVHADLSNRGAASERELLNAVEYAIAHSGRGTNPGDLTNADRPKPPTPKPPVRPVRLFIKYALVTVFFVALILLGNIILRQVHEPSADELYQIGQNYFYGQNGVNQDYVKAQGYYEQAAAKGDSDALCNLGFLYEHGYGVEQDYAKARDYYEQAAAEGNSYALNNLGWLYENGYGVEQDYTKAKDYYKQAVAKDNAEALNNLGWLYYNGYGVEQDYAKAREYCEQAVLKGNAYALCNLGFLYEHGYGVEADYAKAKDYYEQAAAKGVAAARDILGYLYEVE